MGSRVGSFLTGGISDLFQGKPLGQGMGETWNSALGQSNARTLQSLTGLPTFSGSTGEGGTLLQNILGPADNYFYNTSPMQIFGESGEKTVNDIAHMAGLTYLGGVGAGMLGGSSLGAASAWPSTAASGTILGGAAADMAPLEIAAATGGEAMVTPAVSSGASMYAGTIPQAATGGAIGDAGSLAGVTAESLAGVSPSGLATGAGSSVGTGVTGTSIEPLLQSGLTSELPVLDPSSVYTFGQSAAPSLSDYTMGQAALANEAAASQGASSSGIFGTVADKAGAAWNSLGSAKVPVALMAVNLASQALGANSQKGAVEDAANNNREWWNANAYPNSDAVNARSSEAYSNLSAQLAEAKRKLMEDAARRGMKGGSLGGVYNKLNTAAQRSYGQLANDLIQYQNTPRFQPQGTSLTPTVTPATNVANSLNGIIGQLGSLYAYKNMFGNQ